MLFVSSHPRLKLWPGYVVNAATEEADRPLNSHSVVQTSKSSGPVVVGHDDVRSGGVGTATEHAVAGLGNSEHPRNGTRDAKSAAIHIDPHHLRDVDKMISTVISRYGPRT